MTSPNPATAEAVLLPCPFCGSEARHEERHNPMSRWKHSIDCRSSSCGMSGPVASSKAEAARLWNDRAALSAAKPPASGVDAVADFPMGAIENGRALADRLEMTGLECPAGDLRMCSDWQEFRRCFEYLAEWALPRASLSPSTSAAEPVVYGPDEEGLYYTTNVAGMREACDPPAPAAVDGQRALRIALFDLVEWIEMEVDLSLRPGLRKRVADAKALCERPRACLATDKEGA